MNNTEMLKKNYEFKNLFSRGKHYGGKYIEIYILNNNSNKNFIGIAISKKKANSVNRNNIKRLIRENYRLIEKNLKLGYSFIILWKKKANIEEAKFENIKVDMKNIFSKAGILQEGAD